MNRVSKWPPSPPPFQEKKIQKINQENYEWKKKVILKKSYNLRCGGIAPSCLEGQIFITTAYLWTYIFILGK